MDAGGRLATAAARRVSRRRLPQSAAAPCWCVQRIARRRCCAGHGARLRARWCSTTVALDDRVCSRVVVGVGGSRASQCHSWPQPASPAPDLPHGEGETIARTPSSRLARRARVREAATCEAEPYTAARAGACCSTIREPNEALKARSSGCAFGNAASCFRSAASAMASCASAVARGCAPSARVEVCAGSLRERGASCMRITGRLGWRAGTLLLIAFSPDAALAKGFGGSSKRGDGSKRAVSKRGGKSRARQHRAARRRPGCPRPSATRSGRTLAKPGRPRRCGRWPRAAWATTTADGSASRCAARRRRAAQRAVL